MLDLRGAELQAEEREMLLHPLVGGVILFARNYQDPETLISLTSQIHDLRRPALLIAVDHEGGRVQRFHRGFTRLPPSRCFGDLYGQDAERALALVENNGWLLASELLSVGVDSVLPRYWTWIPASVRSSEIAFTIAHRRLWRAWRSV